MMVALVIVDIDVTDPARYETYKRLSEIAVEVNRGRFIVRGGAPETLEGAWAPRRIVVLQFADRAAAHQWYDSPEYREARASREDAAHFRCIVVDALP